QACANCSTPLQGEFCHQCGQHAHNPVRSFVHAVEEVFESFWHLDGRIFRTLRRLLAPGRLARDYLQGRRAPYVAPMRLFVVLCVLTFFVGRGVIHFGNEPGADGAAVTVQTADAGIAQARSVEEVERLRAQRVDELARARDELPAYLAPVRGGFDRTIATLHEQADARVRELGGTSQPRPAADAGPEPQGWLAAQDLRIRRNLARLQEDPELLKHAFLSSMPSALFLLVPVFALLLKLAYLGSGRLYLEHLVVAPFSHAFLCLALLGQMLLALRSRWSARGRRRLGPGSTGAMAVDARLPAADAEAGLCPGLARDPAALRRGGRGVLGADGAGGGRRVRPEPGAALAAGSAQGDLLQPGGPARGGQGQH